MGKKKCWCDPVCDCYVPCLGIRAVFGQKMVPGRSSGAQGVLAACPVLDMRWERSSHSSPPLKKMSWAPCASHGDLPWPMCNAPAHLWHLRSGGNLRSFTGNVGISNSRRMKVYKRREWETPFPSVTPIFLCASAWVSY